MHALSLAALDAASGLATIELADAHRPGGGPQRPENMPFGMFSARGRNARKTIRWMVFSGGRAAALVRPEGPGRGNAPPVL